MLKILLIISIFYIQVAYAKKKPPTTLDTISSGIVTVISDVTAFLEDIMSMITDFVGVNKKPSKTKPNKNTWTLTNLWKYARKNLKSGYKMVQDSISLLNMARSTINDVSPILPNVPASKFIEALLYNLVPELMKIHNSTLEIRPDLNPI